MFLEKRPRPPEEERARFSPPGENGDERTLRRRGAGPPADASPCQRPQDRDHPGPRPPIFAPFCNYGHFIYQDAPWEQTVPGFLCPPFLHLPLMFSLFQHLSHPYPILLHLLRKVCRMADFLDSLKVRFFNRAFYGAFRYFTWTLLSGGCLWGSSRHAVSGPPGRRVFNYPSRYARSRWRGRCRARGTPRPPARRCSGCGPGRSAAPPGAPRRR